MFIVWFMLFMSSVAFGQEVMLLPDCQQINEVFLTAPWFGKVTAAVLSGMAGLRGVAEILMRLAPASKYCQVVLKMATLIGAFGIGTPKGPKKECPK